MTSNAQDSPRPESEEGARSAAFGQRIAQWIRAASGLGVILAGVLVMGEMLGRTGDSQFSVTLEAYGNGNPKAQDISALQSRLSRDWPGIEFVEVTPLAGERPPESEACPTKSASLMFISETARSNFSMNFKRLPELMQSVGLQPCNISYQVSGRQGAGLLSALSQPASSGVPPMGVVLATILLCWRAGWGRAPWPTSKLGPSDALATGVATGVALTLALGALGQGADALGVRLPEQPTLAVGELEAGWWFLLTAIVITPFVEEFAFRAWFLSHSTFAVGPWLSALFSSLAFSAAHFPEAPMQAAGLFCFSIALAALWYRTGSLLACVAAHGTYNAAFVATMAA